MHMFLNNRPVAQMVALDLMAGEAHHAEVRRARRTRPAPASLPEAASLERSRPRWRMVRALHLIH